MKAFTFSGIVFFLLFNIFAFSQSKWTKVSESDDNLILSQIQFTSELTGYASGYYYYSAFGGAVMRTTNGGLNWEKTRFNKFEVTDLFFINSNTGFFTGWRDSYNYVYKTTNSGINWFIADSIYSSFFLIKFYDENIGMIASKYNTFSFTTDGGYNWSTQYNGHWHEPTQILCLDKDTWIVLDNVYGINKTTDRGVNWIYMNYDSIGLECASMFFLNDTTVFAYSYNKTVFKSSNSGNNWFQIGAISNIYSQYYNDIVFLNDMTGYINFYKGVHKTTNGGFNWFNSVADTTTSFNALYFLNRDTGFIAGDKGIIYRTTTGGEEYIPPPVILPDDYNLFQNYPNPFNISTNLNFDVSRNSNISISIYNIAGKKLFDLTNKFYSPGNYSIQWNATDFSSGVYFCKMTARREEYSDIDFSKTIKLVLIK